MINSGRTLSQAIDALFEDINQGVRASKHVQAIDEKDKQDDVVDKLLSSGKDDDQSDDKPAGKDQQKAGSNDKPDDDKGSEDNEKLEDADIEPDDIIEKLNTIRSGKSFKDAEVSQNMEKYISGLKPAEKTALYAFLKGIAEIAAAGIPGAEAEEPEEAPANVHMQKDESAQKQTFHIKPNVIKKNAGTPEHQAPGEENTTAPQKLPIAAKKR